MSETKADLHKWEKVDSETFSMRVPGGWLYLHENSEGQTAMVFVPEPPEPPQDVPPLQVEMREVRDPVGWPPGVMRGDVWSGTLGGE